jgi:hypothetical protein
MEWAILAFAILSVVALSSTSYPTYGTHGTATATRRTSSPRIVTPGADQLNLGGFTRSACSAVSMSTRPKPSPSCRFFRFGLFKEGDEIRHLTGSIRYASQHRGRDAQRSVDPDEIVGEVVQRHGRDVVSNLRQGWGGFCSRTALANRNPHAEAHVLCALSRAFRSATARKRHPLRITEIYRHVIDRGELVYALP